MVMLTRSRREFIFENRERLPKGGLFCFVVAVQHGYRINIGHWLYSDVSGNAYGAE
jgi:hypothetical protein